MNGILCAVVVLPGVKTTALSVLKHLACLVIQCFSVDLDFFYGCVS